MSSERETRERIIAAACQVLAQKGYDAASTKEIARNAGVAQGLINYYFSSKDELFIEVLKAEGQRFCEAMKAVRENSGPGDIYQKAFQNIKDKITHYPEWYRLRYELYALGLRNERITPEVSSLIVESRKNIELILEKLCSRPGQDLTFVAAIVLSALEGLALQKLVNAELNFDRAFDELFQMVRRYLE